MYHTEDSTYICGCDTYIYVCIVIVMFKNYSNEICNIVTYIYVFTYVHTSKTSLKKKKKIEALLLHIIHIYVYYTIQSIDIYIHSYM